LAQVSLALRNCTARSLVLLDEFGKGTLSTGWLISLLRLLLFPMTPPLPCIPSLDETSGLLILGLPTVWAVARPFHIRGVACIIVIILSRHFYAACADLKTTT